MQEEDLVFSKDTIYLDTVFTNIGSSTYHLKVYNRSSKNILIPDIQLKRGDASAYRINVDGLSGNYFENVELLARDSLYIFVETTIDLSTLSDHDKEFLYTDQIVFDSNRSAQEVELVTLVRDAHFIYPQKSKEGMVETLLIEMEGETVETEIEGRYLKDEELFFTNQKPYVIYGYAAVPRNRTLEIGAGVRVHFHSNSGLIVPEGASIKVKGALSLDLDLLENEVIFEGDRLEPEFSEVPGQWGTIWLLPGSLDNEFNHATIKNGTIGILADGNPDAVEKLNLKNTQLYNFSHFGIWGRSTSINGENMVINNCGLSSFALNNGGRCQLVHSTISNYWNKSIRSYPSLYLSNYIVLEDQSVLTHPLAEARFVNCLIYGNTSRELLFDKDASTEFNFHFSNSLIQFEDHVGLYDGAEYDFSNVDLYTECIINGNPDFLAPAKSKLIIGEESDCIGKANKVEALTVPIDLIGKDRSSNPDIGAYQHVQLEEEN